MSQKVSIIIPNWNGKALLRAHLPNVIRFSPNAEIIVSDDASSDGSVEMLRNDFFGVTVISSERRTGFSGTVNRAVAQAKGDIVILLNSDVEPKQGYLAPLLSHFRSGTVAAVGCLEESHEKGTLVQRGRGNAVWKRGLYVHSWAPPNGTDTAWVSGGSGAFRVSVWRQLGGLDELYDPYYWEDIDLSYRIQKAGYDIVFEPKSIVSHYHESGAIKTTVSSRTITATSYRNQFQFVWKNVSDSSIIREHILWTPIRLLQSLISGDTAMIQGYTAALLRIFAIFQSRIKASTHWKIHDRDICPIV